MEAHARDGGLSSFIIYSTPRSLLLFSLSFDLLMRRKRKREELGEDLSEEPDVSSSNSVQKQCIRTIAEEHHAAGFDDSCIDLTLESELITVIDLTVEDNNVCAINKDENSLHRSLPPQQGRIIAEFDLTDEGEVITEFDLYQILGDEDPNEAYTAQLQWDLVKTADDFDLALARKLQREEIDASSHQDATKRLGGPHPVNIDHLREEGVEVLAFFDCETVMRSDPQNIQLVTHAVGLVIVDLILSAAQISPIKSRANPVLYVYAASVTTREHQEIFSSEPSRRLCSTNTKFYRGYNDSKSNDVEAVVEMAQQIHAQSLFEGRQCMLVVKGAYIESLVLNYGPRFRAPREEAKKVSVV